jgi:hypothetical protein
MMTIPTSVQLAEERAAVTSGTWVKLALFSLVFPALCAVLVVAFNIPIAGGGFESDKYAVIAHAWLNNGIWPGFTPQGPEDVPNTIRLPVYPALLAIVFKLFGIDNYLAVLIVQTLLAAATSFFTALAARELRASWMWPAAVFAAVTMNISYRSTLALPDTLLTFWIALVVYFGLRAMSSPRPLRWLTALGVVCAAALLTRPVFQFAAMLGLPVLFLALIASRRLGFVRAAAGILIPVAMLAGAYSAQWLKVQALVGYGAFTTQAGDHALTWLVPCIAQTFACGSANAAKHQEGKRRFAERIATFSPQDQTNPVIIDRTRRALAREMLLEMPLVPTFISAMASYGKLLFHSVVYEAYDRAKIRSVHLTEVPGTTPFEKLRGFVAAIFGSGAMLVWAVSQVAVLLSRCFEAVGLVYGFVQRSLRWQTLYIAALSAGLLAPAVAIGNPRYRAPAEPLLALLLAQGAVPLYQRWRLRVTR